MQNFKKLSRVEMKNVMGGLGGGCGTCQTNGGCSASNEGQGCGSNDGGAGGITIYAGLCEKCTCNSYTYYPCVLQ